MVETVLHSFPEIQFGDTSLKPGVNERRRSRSNSEVFCRKAIPIIQLPSNIAFASSAHSSSASVSARRNAGIAASHRTMLAPPRFFSNS